MSPGGIVIIRTGCANLASVLGAFQRLGFSTRLSDDASEVEHAAAVVLPGVGHFGPAMASLRERGLDLAVIDRIKSSRPVLAICLGMQMLCDDSDESPGVRGMGIIPGRVSRFASGVRVPQMGWNQITPTADARMLLPASVYFANSFRLGAIPNGWAGATAEHGGLFVAAIERGNLLACQFHPELSGAAGLALLTRWAQSAVPREGAPC